MLQVLCSLSVFRVKNYSCKILSQSTFQLPGECPPQNINASQCAVWRLNAASNCDCLHHPNFKKPVLNKIVLFKIQPKKLICTLTVGW